MDRRTKAEAVTDMVTTAITASGISPDSLAKATDIRQPVLRKRLDNPSTFTFAELVRVGGFLSFNPADALGGVK